MTILAEVTYADTTMLAKLTYPEPGAELSMLGAPGDAGDPLAGYDRFGRLSHPVWRKGTTILSDLEYGRDQASRITFKNDLTSPAASDHGQFYRYDGLGQVTSAGVGQVNTGRTAIGGIPAAAESFAYDPQGNWNNYHQSLHGTPEIGQARTHNRDNQRTKIDGASSGLAYDDAGQMTQLPTSADLTGPPRVVSARGIMKSTNATYLGQVAFLAVVMSIPFLGGAEQAPHDSTPTEAIKVEITTPSNAPATLLLEYEAVESDRFDVTHRGYVLYKDKLTLSSSDPPLMVLTRGALAIAGEVIELDVSGLGNCWMLEDATPIPARFVRLSEPFDGVSELEVCMVKGGAEDFTVKWALYNGRSLRVAITPLSDVLPEWVRDHDSKTEE